MTSANPAAHSMAESDEENIPVAQAFVPGSHAPPFQYAQATPVMSAIPAQPVYTSAPDVNTPPQYNAPTPPYTPPQAYTPQPPPAYNPQPPAYTPQPPYTPPTYDQYDVNKPVAAGSLSTSAPAKCLGLPKKLFFVILALIVLVIVGVAVGVGVAASGGKSSKGSNSPPGQTPGTPGSLVTDTPPAPGTPPGEIPILNLAPNPGPSPVNPSPVTPKPTTAQTPPSPPAKTPAPAPTKTATSPVGAPPGSGTFGVLTSDGQDLVTAINSVRVKNGVKALTVDSTLVCTAQRLSQNKGGLTNPKCNSDGFPLNTRITQCNVQFDGDINQLTGCQYYIASNQVDSWATDSQLAAVLLDSTWKYVGGDGYHNGKFWTAIFA